jgi:hypothetical protein
MKEVQVRITFGQIILVAGVPLLLVSGVMHYGGATEAVKHLMAPMAVVMLVIWGGLKLADSDASENKDLTGRLTKLFTFGEPDEDELVSEVDTLKVIVAKANLERSNKRSTLKILEALRKRVVKEPRSALQVVHLGFIGQSLALLEGAKADDLRIPTTFQTINTILNMEDARARVTDDPPMLKETVQRITSLVEEVTEMVREDVTARCQDLYVGMDERIIQNEIFKEVRNSPFAKHGHKCLITLGVLAGDGERAQTRTAEAGAMRITLECLKFFGASPAFAKWAFVALVTMIMDHPANKRDMVMGHSVSGVDVSLDVLRAHPADATVLQIGVGMLWTLLANDPQAKMHLPNVRQSALAGGIVDVVQDAKRAFPDVKELVDACDKVLEVLISDFS